MNSQRRGRNGGRGHRRQQQQPPTIPPPGRPGRGCHRDAITPGSAVFVVQKEDQHSGRETAGIVSRLLTNSSYHPRGIKVMLADGTVGRVSRFDDGTSDDDDVVGRGGGRDAGGGGGGRSDDADGGESVPSDARTLADFLPRAVVVAGPNPRAMDGSALLPMTTMATDPLLPRPDPSIRIDDGAMATLVSMNFDPERARKALLLSKNDVPEAVEYLLAIGSFDDG
mmetsp:Transcript_23294/g.56202  ORF Transcript_23294/g.56202 Transcript_23294/m.56202 type:complete len:225 (-) Transcript_23294:146-820(-)